MANTKSALKYIRKSAARTLRNRQQKSRLENRFPRNWMQPLRKQMEAAIQTASRAFISALDKAGKSGIVHANKIARHKARCAALQAS